MKYFNLFISLVFLSTGGFAQKKPVVVTLNECIAIAIQNNTSIKASEEDKHKALAEYRVAKAQRIPTFEADIRSQQYPRTIITSQLANNILTYASNDPNSTVLASRISKRYTRSKEGSFVFPPIYYLGINFALVANIPLYDERKNRAIDSAKSVVQLSKFQSSKALYEAIYDVKKNYYSYITAADNISFREKLLKSNEERLRITELLYKNGQKPILDLDKARYDYNDAKLELRKAKNSSRVARLQLFTSMGIPDTGVNIVLQEYGEFPEIKYGLKELNKLGDSNYPDLQIAREQRKNNKIKIDVERAAYYPTVDLQGGGGIENGALNLATIGKDLGNPANWKGTGFVAFVARVPIWSGGIVDARIDSAIAEYNKSVYREKETVLAMRATIENSHSTLQELQEQIDISRLLLDNANKQVLYTRKMYQSGAGTQLDLHDANASLINAQIGYTKAKYDYLVTLAKLSSIVGLGEDSLCKK